MSTLSRATGKALLTSESNFLAVTRMVEKSVDKENPSLVKSLSKNRAKMDESFLDLNCCYDRYKADTLSRENNSEIVFNEVEEDVPKYKMNDMWMEENRERYYSLVDSSDEKLEEIAPAVGSKEEKAIVEDEKKALQVLQDKKATCLLNQMQIFKDSTSSTIDKIGNEVMNLKDAGECLAKITSIQSVLQGLEIKLGVEYSGLVEKLFCLLPDLKIQEIESERIEYVKKEKIRLENLQLMLFSKIGEGNMISKSPAASETQEQTYLKKSDPPRWEGDPAEFAEFSRKWKAQVHTARLPMETELDKLRESIPAQASKALYGESSLDKAWKMLESLYGDKDLIANKLKSQLKNIRSRGKSDYDVVIDLVTDVNNIVLRLKAIGKEEVLHVDNEFLASVYKVLPYNCQVKWLEQDTSLYRSKWAAFTKFLEIAREQAVKSKVLLATCEQKEVETFKCRNCGAPGHKASKCPIGAHFLQCQGEGNVAL